MRNIFRVWLICLLLSSAAYGAEWLDSVQLMHQGFAHGAPAVGDGPLKNARAMFYLYRPADDAPIGIGNVSLAEPNIPWPEDRVGWVQITERGLPEIWQPGPMVWFRIDGSGSDIPYSDTWITRQATWSEYVGSGDRAALEAQSWRFRAFHLHDDYQFPEPFEPVEWQQHSDQIMIGTHGDNVVLILRHGDGWEWTIRGSRGSDAWVSAESLTAAQAAAEQQVKRSGN